tara:strand:- start:2178 stop:2366 length:189 start_codon:yes stop_codon:yes gene_type:complete
LKRRVVNFEVSLREVKGDANRLIKRFVKKTKKSGLLEEVRERRFYEKPSDKKRRKRKKRKND